MKSALVCVLCIVSLSAAVDVFNVNGYLDPVLDFGNQFLTSYGLGVLPLHPYTLVGLNSLYRTGDATLRLDGDTLTGDVRLGLRLLDVAFRNFSLPGGRPFSGVVRAKYNSFRITMTIEVVREGPPMECRISFDNLQVERLEGVTLDASLEEYNGVDVTGFFATQVLPLVNGELDRNIKTALGNLVQERLCSNSLDNLGILGYINKYRM